SQWIGAYPTNYSTGSGQYAFETEFCLEPDATNLVLNFCLRADDSASASLNGHPITLTPTDTTFYAPSPACGTVSMSAHPDWFVPGKNKLRVTVNDEGGAMGLNVSGSLSGSGIIA